MYRAEKTHLKYLKPETARIEANPVSGSGFDIIDDTGHIYQHATTLEDASAVLIKVHSEYVSAEHNYYLATEAELNARYPAPLTEKQIEENRLVNEVWESLNQDSPAYGWDSGEWERSAGGR